MNSIKHFLKLRKCVYASAHGFLQCPWGDFMFVKDAVVNRFQNLCAARKIAVNELANLSGVTPSTAYSMMDPDRRDVSITTIKKFCDGLDISLGEFFSSPEFEGLEQEIK